MTIPDPHELADRAIAEGEWRKEVIVAVLGAELDLTEASHGAIFQLRQPIELDFKDLGTVRLTAVRVHVTHYPATPGDDEDEDDEAAPGPYGGVSGFLEQLTAGGEPRWRALPNDLAAFLLGKLLLAGRPPRGA
jgi:hypothetical protein